MVWKNRNKLLVVFTLVLLIGTSAASRPRKTQRTVAGTWGGPHINIQVTGRSASVQYDCADGTIKGPLTIDSAGKFTWVGTYNRGHGGPVRIDEKPRSRPAVYTGWIRGDTMTLTVKLTDTDETFDPFTLKRGSSGRLWRCM
jgi:hypothetical protein